MTAKPLLLRALDWTAIGTAFGAALSKAVSHEDWTLPLLSASITAVATRFTAFLYDWESHKRRTEAAIQLLSNEKTGEQELETRILRMLLQSVVFAPNDFDDRVWVELGKLLLDEAREDSGSAVQKVLSLQRSKEFRSGKRRYLYMDAVLRCVEEYRGVAFIEEFTDAKKVERAHEFIFELPKFYASKGVQIYRLFVANSDKELVQAFTSEQREQLAKQLEQARPVKLRWCPPETPGLSNFGIYGNIALGSMSKGENIIYFSAERVRQERRNWDTAWDLSESRELSRELLTTSTS